MIALLLETLAVVGFLLYRYVCHNKGAYRTTGEPAPGEDFAEDRKPNQATNDKKEYFIWTLVNADQHAEEMNGPCWTHWDKMVE